LTEERARNSVPIRKTTQPGNSPTAAEAVAEEEGSGTMVRFGRWTLLFLGLMPAILRGQAAPVQPGAQPAVVRAVLFYSPTCPHCHRVMTVDLPPLIERYGSRLRLASVNTATPGGQALYQATVEHFAIPEDRLGVPTLVVGNRVLVGSLEIPAEFPGIVERGLAAGGVGWPEVTQIREAVAAGERAAFRSDTAAAAADTAPAAPRDTVRAAPALRRTPATADSAVAAPRSAPMHPAAEVLEGAADSPAAAAMGQEVRILAPGTGAGPGTVFGSMRARFLVDPVGNSVSVVVLLFMLAAVGLAIAAVSGRPVPVEYPPSWVLPALGIVGLGVASYLSFVEVTGAPAICGPVGDCNTVQQSEYARIFGVVPVGVLGAFGYVAMSVLWFAGTRAPGRTARAARICTWCCALGGVVFSVYLTFLEPFVIGASCAWCLASAVIVTLMLLAVTPAVRLDLEALRTPGVAAAH
jgi:uncharacterized membrane protein